MNFLFLKLIIYIIMSLFCVFVCMACYRLGPWTSYRHEISIIRTSRTWGCATWKKFPRKVTSGQISEQKCFATSAFQWENFLYIFLPFILNGPTSNIYWYTLSELKLFESNRIEPNRGYPRINPRFGSWFFEEYGLRFDSVRRSADRGYPQRTAND